MIVRSPVKSSDLIAATGTTSPAVRRLAVVVGSAGSSPEAGSLPCSDRAAVALAVRRFLEGQPAGMHPPDETAMSRLQDRWQPDGNRLQEYWDRVDAADSRWSAPVAIPHQSDAESENLWYLEACSFNADDVALRYALAAGANTASRLDAPDQLDFDVALLGEGGAGPAGDLLPAMLAEFHQAALVLDVLDVEPVPEGLRVLRDLGRGAREILRVTGPAVLVVSPEAARPLYVSRHRWRSARLDRIEDRRGVNGRSPAPVEPQELNGAGWEPARPRTHGAHRANGSTSALQRMGDIFGIEDTGPADESSHVIQADARTCAKHLLRFLGHYGFIERAPTDEETGGGLTATAETAAVAETRMQPASAVGVEPMSQAQGPRKRGPRPTGRAPRGNGRGPRPRSNRNA